MGFIDKLFGKKSAPRGKHAVFPPRRGFITQCVCVLLDAPVRIGAVTAALSRFQPKGERPAAPGEHGWALGGPSVVLPFRPDVNGVVVVDVVERPWPDGMGSPQGAESQLFAAWAMGQFGPCTFPGTFARAVTHAYRDRAVAETAAKHSGFLRVRSTYAIGARPESPVLPADHDPLAELRFVTDVALAALGVRGTICVFNPNGELLLAGDDAAELRDLDQGAGVVRVDQWANVRMFRPQGLGATEWLVFDTVGLEQLDVRDHEAALPSSDRAGELVPGLLHTMGAYDVARRGVMGMGDTATDLDGVLWRAKAEGDALIDPPRPILRWFPDDIEPPRALSRRARG